MSKKEQKLKKNLYKALTEYFIHNPKNSLPSVPRSWCRRTSGP